MSLTLTFSRSNTDSSMSWLRREIWVRDSFTMVRSSSLLSAPLTIISVLMPIMRIRRRVMVFSSQTSGIISTCSGASKKLLG